MIWYEAQHWLLMFFIWIWPVTHPKHEVAFVMTCCSKPANMKFPSWSHLFFFHCVIVCHTSSWSSYSRKTGWWWMKVISFTFQLGYFLLLASKSNRGMFAKVSYIILNSTEVHKRKGYRVQGCVCVCAVVGLSVCVCTWLVNVCVTNAGLNFSSVQRSHWERDGGLLRSGGLPIVALTSGRSPLLTVSTDLLQHTGDIWSSLQR